MGRKKSPRLQLPYADIGKIALLSSPLPCPHMDWASLSQAPLDSLGEIHGHVAAML